MSQGDCVADPKDPQNHLPIYHTTRHENMGRLTHLTPFTNNDPRTFTISGPIVIQTSYPPSRPNPYNKKKK